MEILTNKSQPGSYSKKGEIVITQTPVHFPPIKVDLSINPDDFEPKYQFVGRIGGPPLTKKVR